MDDLAGSGAGYQHKKASSGTERLQLYRLEKSFYKLLTLTASFDFRLAALFL